MFALADDALEVHERVGLRIAEALALPSLIGLRPADAGELLVWAAVGIPLLAAAAVAVIRSPEEDRRNGLLLVGGLALLALFAVVADMAHMALRGTFWGADDLLIVIEDGGEQLTLSLICGLAVLIWREVRGREQRRRSPA